MQHTAQPTLNRWGIRLMAERFLNTLAKVGPEMPTIINEYGARYVATNYPYTREKPLASHPFNK